VSLPDAPAEGASASNRFVPMMVGGRDAGRDYRELTKFENKRFRDGVNVFFSTKL
jgi:hypothetical protein